MGAQRHTTPRKLSWWNRQVLSFLLRQWRIAQRKQATAANRLTAYADQLGHWDWAIKCVQSDRDASWAKDPSGLSHPINHRASAPATAPAAALPIAPAHPSFSDAMPASVRSKHSDAAHK